MFFFSVEILLVTTWRKSLRSLRLCLFCCNLGVAMMIESEMRGCGKSLYLKESSSLPYVVVFRIVFGDLVLACMMFEASREAYASGKTSRVSRPTSSFFRCLAISLSNSNCNCASSNSMSVISVSILFLADSAPLGVESNNFSILIGFKVNLDVVCSPH